MEIKIMPRNNLAVSHSISRMGVCKSARIIFFKPPGPGRSFLFQTLTVGRRFFFPLPVFSLPLYREPKEPKTGYRPIALHQELQAHRVRTESTRSWFFGYRPRLHQPESKKHKQNKGRK